MKDFFSGNKIKIFLHFLAWAILLALPVYIVQRWDVGKDFIWFYYISTVVSGLIFYINYLFLVPRYFFNKKRVRYYLLVCAVLTLFYIISNGSNELVSRYVPGQSNVDVPSRAQNELHNPGPPAPDKFFGRPPFRQMHLVNYIFTSMFLVFFSLGLRVLERQSAIEKLQKELEREKLNSELAFLKNQISPHFFFNTLNNIYSLISINQEDSQKAVLKLSKLMRYLLYESDHGNTKLSNEIEFMNNYIDLMKLRMSEKINLSFSFPEKYDDKSIPPLLFIPFIENAFKHGISYREKSFIDICMTSTQDTISFRCKNSIAKSREDSDRVHSGIGLENVSKRLNLLFPGKHDLEINKSDTEFEILLRIIFA
jgi:two-component system LytT family sensor kinase